MFLRKHGYINGLSFGAVHAIISEGLCTKQRICLMDTPFFDSPLKQTVPIKHPNCSKRLNRMALNSLRTSSQVMKLRFTTLSYHRNTSIACWLTREETNLFFSSLNFMAERECLLYFLNYGRPLVVDILPTDSAMTPTYYVQKVLAQVKLAADEQQPKVSTSQVLLHHDNSWPCKSRATTQSLQVLEIQVLPHPAYTCDLSLCAFWLFPVLKNIQARC